MIKDWHINDLFALRQLSGILTVLLLILLVACRFAVKDVTWLAECFETLLGVTQ